MLLRYQPPYNNETIFVQGFDQGNGKYNMSYTPKYRGVHALHIFLRGQPIAGSPYSISTQWGDVDPKACVAYDYPQPDLSKKGGLTGGRAGREYTFGIKCNDEFGNLIERGSKWKHPNLPFMVKLQGLRLFWATVVDNNDGTYTAKFNIEASGIYMLHIQYKLTAGTYVAIWGSPHIAVITKVPCPIVGETPCSGIGQCLDTGLCKCPEGFDGEYCQTDLAYFFRIGIIVESAFLLVFVCMFLFSVIWKKCVRDKQLYERFMHDDAEDDW